MGQPPAFFPDEESNFDDGADARGVTGFVRIEEDDIFADANSHGSPAAQRDRKRGTGGGIDSA